MDFARSIQSMLEKLNDDEREAFNGLIHLSRITAMDTPERNREITVLAHARTLVDEGHPTPWGTRWIEFQRAVAELDP